MASDGVWVPDPDAEDKYPPPKKGMNRMTLKLIRKRAEHNEGIISTLEELTLHQEELVAIEPCLGTTCRKLKILYLQNNIISKIQHLHHLKDLEYLNMALNNVSKIEGLDKCEFLNKLDLTVNFVDVDELEASMDHLADREHLKDLYMMGNPAQANWPGFKNYVIARLPQLQFLDGEAITRSMQIIAKQQLPKLAVELRSLAQEKRDEKAAKEFVDYRDIDTDEKAPYTPEVRMKMYEELAEEKAEKENRELRRQPRERDHAGEQRKKVERVRQREEEGKILQCNEGKWEFHFDEESVKGSIILDLHVSRHLDSSLIDLDIHPAYVSVVIKSKVLRLKLPSEVNASLSTAKRSKVTGHLLIEMPKINENAPTLFGKNKARAEKEERLKRLNGDRKAGPGAPPTQSKKQSVGVHAKPLDNRRPALSASMADLMVKDSSSRRKKDGMAAVSTRRVDEPPPPPAATPIDDDDEPPPPC
mmetsp:Transcript_16750/g.43917  ORF Transcript_16750/g.43917 Transcript_16750/m.43917 type:complete len:475 (-) Transcript_16750:35-1459(-)